MVSDLVSRMYRRYILTLIAVGLTILSILAKIVSILAKMPF